MPRRHDETMTGPGSRGGKDWVNFSINLPPHVYKQLRTISDNKDQPISQIVRAMLTEQLKVKK